MAEEIILVIRVREVPLPGGALRHPAVWTFMLEQINSEKDLGKLKGTKNEINVRLLYHIQCNNDSRV